MSIKYYHLAKDEELPDEFCAVRDVGGEPSEYTFYVSEAENAKLRELAWTLANCAAGHGCDYCPINGGYGYVGELDMCESVHANMRELGVEAE